MDVQYYTTDVEYISKNLPVLGVQEYFKERLHYIDLVPIVTFVDV